jgi:spore coat polysaccharide biosynthesis protein SpsF
MLDKHTHLWMHIVASVQARLGSTRLPGKVLFQLGDRRLLKWSIDRTEVAKTVDKTVATIGDQPENEALEEYCERNGINYAVGPERNLLVRHLAVAEQTNCDLLVRITADCPFVPSAEIDRVVKEHLANDAAYTTNVTENMPVGTGVDAIDPSLLAEFESIGESHPVKLARSKPKEWETMWTENQSWRTISDAHIAVDTPSDYWSLTDALDAVGDNPRDVAEWISK